MFYPIRANPTFTAIENNRRLDRIERVTFNSIQHDMTQSPLIGKRTSKDAVDRVECAKLFLNYLYQCRFHPTNQRIIELGSGLRNSMAQFIRGSIELLSDHVIEEELRHAQINGKRGTLPFSSQSIAENYDTVISVNYSKDLFNINNYPFEEVYIGFCEPKDSFYAHQKKMLYDALYKALNFKRYRMIEEEMNGYNYQLIKRR